MHSSVRASGERLTALIKVDICTISHWNRSLNSVGIYNLLFLHLDFPFDLSKSAEAHDFTGRSKFTIVVHRLRQN